jgi:alkylhydroperoxidase family enzyme
VEAGYTREQAGELTFLVAIEAITSRLATPLALPFSEVEQWRASWWGRLFRPVLARAIRSLQRKQPDRVLTAEELGRPFGGLLAPLGASPAAGLLRQAIDDCLSSGLADLRTKVLAIGVVGRAAGCAYTEREARALWEGTGLDPKVFDEVMTHLASPSLSAFEHRVVRYARQSVAYEVSQFQGLARTLADGIAHGVLVDVVGTVALANGLVRLGILVET